MKLSKRGIIEIASHEAVVRSPYYDSVGVLTFGIGHTAAAGVPDPRIDLNLSETYSLKYVMMIFKKDIQKYEERVNEAVTVPLKQYEFDALVSFDYNTGGIFRARLTKWLNQGKRKRAGLAFMGWIKPKAIIGRRKKEMDLFLKGKYSSNHQVTEYMTDGKGWIRWSSAHKVDILEHI